MPPRRAALVAAVIAYLLAGGSAVHGPLPWCGPDAWPQTSTWPDGRAEIRCAPLPPSPSLDH